MKPCFSHARNISVLLLAISSLSACGVGGPAYSAPASRNVASVEMGLHSYSPATITIRRGQSVEWRNTSIITHTVTDNPRLAKKKRDAVLPAGASAFHSGDIAAGQTYVHKFTVPGTYRYFCTRHEQDGMTGRVIVTR